MTSLQTTNIPSSHRSRVVSFYACIIKNAKLVTLMWLVLAAGLMIPASSFDIDASADTLLTNNNQAFLNTRQANQQFSPEEFLVIAYQPHHGSVLESNALTNIKSLSSELSELKRVKVVRSLLNVPLLTTIPISEIDGDLTKSSIENNQYAPDFLSDIFKDHPIYEDLIISKDQKFAALQVIFHADEELDAIDRELLAFDVKLSNNEKLSEADKEKYQKLSKNQKRIQHRLDKQRSEEYQQIQTILTPYQEEASLYLGGVHVIGQELVNIVESDLLAFGLAVLVVICILLLSAFRSFRWLLITLICCTCCVVITIGVLSLFNFQATVVSANFVALQLILVLALVIHLISHYLEVLKQQTKADSQEILLKTMQSKTRPSVFAAITTSVGFISLITADVQPVISFGIMMLIATAVLLIVCLTLFPALSYLLIRNDANTKELITGKKLKWLAGIITDKPKSILSVYILLTVILASGIFRLSVENSFINYFDKDTDVYKGLSVIDKNLGGTTPLDIIITIPEEHKKQDLDITALTVQNLQQIHSALAEFESVGNTLSIYNFTELAKQINKNKPLTEYELNSIYKLAEPSVRNELIGSFYDNEQQEIRISTRVIDSTENLNRNELLSEIRSIISGLGFSEDSFLLTGLLVVYDEILQKLFKSQILTIAIVFVALFIILLMLFKSLTLALIALSPNIAATLSLLGFIGWMGIPLDFMTITIAAISMGIATDDTIHYLVRYQEELTKNDAKQAVSLSHFSVGKSVCLTSMVVIFGFAVMLFSDFIPSMLFGLLTSLSMFFALISTLVMLPILLFCFYRKPTHTD